MQARENVTGGDDLNEVERLVRQHPEHAKSLSKKVGPSAERYLLRVLSDVQ